MNLPIWTDQDKPKPPANSCQVLVFIFSSILYRIFYVFHVSSNFTISKISLNVSIYDVCKLLHQIHKYEKSVFASNTKWCLLTSTVCKALLAIYHRNPIWDSGKYTPASPWLQNFYLKIACSYIITHHRFIYLMHPWNAFLFLEICHQS